MNSSLFIGLLSGSSMDAVDAALVSFEDPNQPKLLYTETYPIPADFKSQCLKLSQHGQGSIDEFGSLDAMAGELFSAAVLHLLKQANVKAEQIRAIGSHGQNLRHRPNAIPPFSLQIGDPNIIAERTGILTIADFRRRDLAAGGQGAPLAPGFHAVVFGHPTENRVIVNIGGISNITLLPRSEPPKSPHEEVISAGFVDNSKKIIGFDTGPGNCLMDSWAEKYWSVPFDDEGKIAAQGMVDQTLLEVCLNDPYFNTAPPKSTGREYFNLGWLAKKMDILSLGVNRNSENENQSLNENQNLDTENLQNGPRPTCLIAPEDIQATLLYLTATSLSNMINVYAEKNAQVFICGGGACNTYLMQTLNHLLQRPVQSTEALGIAPEWVEAMLFAWLAKQTLSGKSGNCPSVTGAKHAIPLGGIFGYAAEAV